MNKFFITLLILLMTASHAYAFPRPEYWHENDWVKFVDAAVVGSLGDAFLQAGGQFPLMDAYSALSATASATKTGLIFHLQSKMRDAVFEDDLRKLGRYQAFYSCLVSSDCNELRNIEYYEAPWTLDSESLNSRTFNKPTFQGNRLDWCRRYALDCGRGAANSYCEFKGFTRAKNWEIDENIGSYSPTRIIETGQICDTPGCDGFKFIECE